MLIAAVFPLLDLKICKISAIFEGCARGADYKYVARSLQVSSECELKF